MATSAEIRVVSGAALVQGVVLVTFPAAATVLTDPDGYGLSRTQYGTLFLPQMTTAVATSLVSGSLARSHGLKRVYLAGVLCSFVAMALLAATTPIQGRPGAFTVLLFATAFVGAGFGLTVPALNTLTVRFHPAGADRAVLMLNALLGVGTALAPAFVAVFVGLGIWWALPVLAAVLLAGLALASLPLPLGGPGPVVSDVHANGHRPSEGNISIPPRFWIFGGFAVLYGVCETVNGNWAQLEMTGELGASAAVASLALTAFWALVTVGRLLFAALERLVPTTRTYHVLPFVLAGALAIVAALPAGAAGAGVAAFALAGLGCSALLPLTISYGEAQLATMAAAVAGMIIACYQVGYGLAAFGLGSLQEAGVALPTLFAGTAVLAVLMGATAFAITAGRNLAVAQPTPAATGGPGA
jgi:predicted MFS family arabinose efflux permease